LGGILLLHFTTRNFWKGMFMFCYVSLCYVYVVLSLCFVMLATFSRIGYMPTCSKDSFVFPCLVSLCLCFVCFVFCFAMFMLYVCQNCVYLTLKTFFAGGWERNKEWAICQHSRLYFENISCTCGRKE